MKTRTKTDIVRDTKRGRDRKKEGRNKRARKRACEGRKGLERKTDGERKRRITKPGAGIMEADDRQVTTVFTVQPSFHHRHSTNRVS